MNDPYDLNELNALNNDILDSLMGAMTLSMLMDANEDMGIDSLLRLHAEQRGLTETEADTDYQTLLEYEAICVRNRMSWELRPAGMQRLNHAACLCSGNASKYAR